MTLCDCRYGWRWVLRTFSLLSLLAALAGCSMVTLKSPGSRRAQVTSDDGLTPGRRGSLLVSLVLGRELAASPRLAAYLLFSVADFLAFCAIYIPYTHLPPLAAAHGVSPSHAALLIR